MARTKVCDLAEIAWISAITPERWIGAQEFRRIASPGISDMSMRRRWTLSLGAAKTLDWPLERRTVFPTGSEDGHGMGGGRLQVRPLSTALVLDAHLAAYKAGALYPGFGADLARLAARYPFAAFGGDPMDKAAIAAGLRGPEPRFGEEAVSVVHEAALGRVTVRDGDGVAAVWAKEAGK